ncbi:hypothetical protein KI387_013755, partial [Taxus chinensis]
RLWERDIWEIQGKFPSKYRHRIVHQLLRSYSELNPALELVSEDNFVVDRASHYGREWISSVEFDSKGIYLVSVTSTGCLRVHDYETLYCQRARTRIKDRRKKNDFRDETRPIVEVSTCERLDAVHWNPTNQDEVGCVSERNGKVLLFDIGYESSKPSQVLERKLNPSMQENMEHFGLTDLAFSCRDKFRCFTKKNELLSTSITLHISFKSEELSRSAPILKKSGQVRRNRIVQTKIDKAMAKRDEKESTMESCIASKLADVGDTDLGPEPLFDLIDRSRAGKTSLMRAVKSRGIIRAAAFPCTTQLLEFVMECARSYHPSSRSVRDALVKTIIRLDVEFINYCFEDSSAKGGDFY